MKPKQKPTKASLAKQRKWSNRILDEAVFKKELRAALPATIGKLSNI
jgi:hypothetical protein